MCRFTFYRGEPITLSALLTEPTNSLIHQSFHAHERAEPLNGDGFGVAWYADGDPKPVLLRSVTPAWSNENLMDLARVTRSGCVLAHVRAATQGLAVAVANCHPFRRDRLTFMHNGDIGGFRAIRRALLAELSDEAFAAIGGATDSEHFFALCVDELDRATAPAGSARMAEALRAAIRRVIELVVRLAPGHTILLNAVLTDGRETVACRYTTGAPERANSLYLHRGRRYVCEDGVCRMLEPGEGETALLVSSEPLSRDPGWEAVPVNHLVRIPADLRTTIEPVAA